MPQMNKGGKFIFGVSVIRMDGSVTFPLLAIDEYEITSEGKVYLFTGSKITGGFCVSRKGLMLPSKLGHILEEIPGLRDYTLPAGEFVPYKGKSYCWTEITKDGMIILSGKMMDILELRPGKGLLSIRSSNIAFTMGARGPLFDRMEGYSGAIEIY